MRGSSLRAPYSRSPGAIEGVDDYGCRSSRSRGRTAPLGNRDMTENDKRVLVTSLRDAYGWAATETNITRQAIDAALSLLYATGVLTEEEAKTPEPYEQRG